MTSFLPKNGRMKNQITPVTVLKVEDRFLEIKRLSKSYLEGSQNRVVFQEVNLDVAHGEVVAILGKSGSGKTTLLNLISGVDRVDSGQILMEELDLTALSDLQMTLFRRQKIGFIFQFFNLIPTLTVWENLTLPLELNGMTTPADLLRAEELLAEVGLANRKKTFPDRMSGGEQQRIAIARALVHNPLLVLADEPTGNLDEETGRHVLNLLERLTRQSGKSMLLVTHSVDAAGIADRVFALKEGHLVEQEKVR